MEARTDGRLRTWIAVTAGLGASSYAAFAVATWRNPWRFLAFSLLVESVLVLVVLCVLAVLNRWLVDDGVRRAVVRPESDAPERRTTPRGERRAA